MDTADGKMESEMAGGKTCSERMMAFATGLEYERIPAAAIDAAKHHMLDALGVALASSRSDTARTVMATANRLGGRPDCTVLGRKERYPAPAAAFVNASMCHTPDFDDTHGGSVIHPSCVVVPVALAVGEERGVTGKEFLTALVAGYEILLRIGLSAPGKFHRNGFHPTGACGAFGSAVVASRLGGLGREAAVNALGISGSFASGLLEFLSDGSSAKRVHPGWASFGGIIASQLAADGLTGPRTVLEGPNGFLRSHLREEKYDIESLIGTLGKRWETERISYKMYPCCHFLSAFIDCARVIKARHAPRAEEIEAVECVIAPEQARLVCEPDEGRKRPRTPYDAKFSLPYAAALGILRGDCVLGDFTEESIRDEEVLRLAGKVGCTLSESTGDPQVFPGWMKVRMRNGAVYEHREGIQRGGPENPVGTEDIVRKFENNARAVYPEGRVAGIRDAALDIGSCRDIRSFTRALGGAA